MRRQGNQQPSLTRPFKPCPPDSVKRVIVTNTAGRVGTGWLADGHGRVAGRVDGSNHPQVPSLPDGPTPSGCSSESRLAAARIVVPPVPKPSAALRRSTNPNFHLTLDVLRPDPGFDLLIAIPHFTGNGGAGAIWQSTQLVKYYAEAGERIFATVFRDSAVAVANGRATMAGYLVDVP